ncbi:methylenetetrahydrofolate reductase [Nesterenkonia marinintestina]|uniref:methylenetetrahydrofolate reductase n=1 Tax=Nesterenkonia marinintestina TaxID=2979865 RepID=UPI0021BE3433|nr:methylenetetrahydrofolate reductase [Nesterenkonia sp. GX14115]
MGGVGVGAGSVGPPSPLWPSVLGGSVRFEVIPLDGVVDAVLTHLDPEDVVTVTASPRHGLQGTLEVVDALSAEGRRAVPHLAARMIRGPSETEEIVARLGAAGVDEVFVIGGDAARPAGPYGSAEDLMRSLLQQRPDLRIGIAGYPEPHPGIAPEDLDAAWAAKREHASEVVSQMCFDAEAIVDWISGLPGRGVGPPVRLGVAGPTSTARLIRVGARIGVGDSLRVLSRHRGGLRALMGPGTWTPDALLDEVVRRSASADDLGPVGLHLYTFNAVADSARWWRRVRRSAGDDEHRGTEHQS